MHLPYFSPWRLLAGRTAALLLVAAGGLVVPAAVAADDGPTFKTDSATHTTLVQTKAYQATVDSDGCLSSFKVGGQEFLLSRQGALPRGFYLYQKGVVALTEISPPDNHTLTAKSEIGSVKYEFRPHSLIISATNASTDPVVCYGALASGVTALIDNSGKATKTPVDLREQPTTNWFAGKSRLKISAPDRQPALISWGDDKIQIWVSEINPSEACTVTLEAGEATNSELDNVGKAKVQTKP